MVYVKSENRVNKKCVRCGNFIWNRFAHAKYCLPCKKIIPKEQMQKYWKKKHQKMVVGKKAKLYCKQCKGIIYNRANNAIYCSECIMLRDQKSRRKSYLKLKRKIKK